MRAAEFDDLRAWWDDREENERAWQVGVADVVASGYNLDIKNPNTIAAPDADPEVLLEQYRELLDEVAAVRAQLQTELARALAA